METASEKPIPTLDLHRVQAAVGSDGQDRPTIVLTDGTTEVVLAGGDKRHENLAGASRVMGAIFDYQQLEAVESHTAERVDRLAAQYGLEANGPVSEASIADDEKRIAELRGPSPSVSGKY